MVCAVFQYVNYSLSNITDLSFLFSMTISSPNETWTSRSRVETAKRKKRPVFADIRSIEAKTTVFSGNLLAPRGMLAVTRYTRSSVIQSFFVKLNHSIQIPSLIETQTVFHPVPFIFMSHALTNSSNTILFHQT